jgi:hypothetical protein
MKQKWSRDEVPLPRPLNRLPCSPGFQVILCEGRSMFMHETSVSLGCVGSAPAVGVRSMKQSQGNPPRALIVCAVWLHIGFIAASALAAGLLQLIDAGSESGSGWAWALVIAGGALTVVTWRRSRIALELAEQASADVASAPIVHPHSTQNGRGAMSVSDSSAARPRERSCP